MGERESERDRAHRENTERTHREITGEHTEKTQRALRKTPEKPKTCKENTQREQT